MLTSLFVIGLCAFREFGVEAGVKVYFEDMAITEINEKYLDAEKTDAYIVEDEEGDENTITSILVLVKKPPPETEARFTLTGLSMGKYTLPTGVDLKMGLCDMLDEPIIMGPFFAVLGFTQDSCPPEPGTYSKEGYKLPLDALPDEFPENKYLVNFEISIKGKPMIAVNIYANVQSD